MKYIKLIKQLLKNPIGMKHKFICPNCKKASYLEPKPIEVDTFTVGWCWNCEHPIWV
jgi:hypothetical protein